MESPLEKISASKLTLMTMMTIITIMTTMMTMMEMMTIMTIMTMMIINDQFSRHLKNTVKAPFVGKNSKKFPNGIEVFFLHIFVPFQ